MLDQIKAAKPGDLIRDKGEPGSVVGLELRVVQNMRNGQVSRRWFFYHRTREGVQRRPKLGDYPQVSLAEARKRAVLLQRQVAAGEDPAQDWKAARKEKTVGELWEAVKADYYSKARFQASKWAKTAEYIYGKHLGPEFGSMRLSELSVKAIRNWHSRLDHMPHGANRALAILKKMFNWAIEQEWILQGTNPAKLVKQHPEVERERYMTDAELTRIGAILYREADARPAAVAYLLLLFLSGARPSAIERARWNDLTVFEKEGKRYGVLAFKGKSSGKTGSNERVVLPPEAMDVLDRLPRVVGKTITGIKAPREFWESIRTEIGAPDLRMRDSRRTFATVGMSECELPMDQISPVLCHADPATTAIYAKLIPRVQIEVASKITSAVYAKLGSGGK